MEEEKQHVEAQMKFLAKMAYNTELHSLKFPGN